MGAVVTGRRHARAIAKRRGHLQASASTRCSQIGSYAQAQLLLRKGHTYLDGNGDGEACESLRW